MPHVIGTAGHIDHGKTALIRALTGQDTDRLKEEKERGISIDLGFAYMDLSGGERVGIVDVPGHERFIRNMLAGVERVVPPGYFRLPVDRAFIMHGHGTVVTGTAIAGSVRPGDVVRILPGGAEARVRSVQVHGDDVAEATYGQRVALNLAGVE